MSSWKEVNKNLIAKALGEMIFEETISIEEQGDLFLFKTSPQVQYTFEGKKSLWGWIKIEGSSIKRNQDDDFEASQFFIDTQEFTQMNDITLAQFIEESRSTLFADLHLNHEVSAKEFINLNFLESQQLLNGHPKIIMNKGRLGWSAEDWKSFAPENTPIFPLKVIAIRKNLLKGILPSSDLYLHFFTPDKLREIQEEVDFHDYALMPVHPWQWNNVILYHYQSAIQNKSIIDLGMSSFHYSPQTSLRTLNCIENLTAPEVKLPLSILNTSCVRGIPARTIELGVKISRALTTLIEEDHFLKDKVEVLSEMAGINFVAPDLEQIKKAPYRFQEFLGAIWRESSFSKEKDNEKIILTANLLYVDKHQRSSLTEYIKASGLTPTEWLREYTRTIILPLFHLQTKHGIGLVSHGQNIMMILENFKPKRLVLKDFQGDFRLSQNLPGKTQKLFHEVHDHVLKLPAEHLIHDLYTAHFVTLLRYVSMNLSLNGVMTEKDFYQIISEEILIYEKEFQPNISLLKKDFEKILINTVRFRVGYGDSAARPIPLLGTTISNPLHQVSL